MTASRPSHPIRLPPVMSDTDQGESFAIEADGDDERGGSTSLAALGRGAKAFFDWALVVVIALVVALGVRTFLLAHFVVEGSSMYSTLETGDRVFVNKVSYRLHDPNRGDVVVLHEIRGTTERDLIKRVIAVGGEEVEMRSCEVRIGGQLLIEPYLDPTVVTPGNCGGDFGPLLVPEGTVFVMGDNRAGSQDSRTLGPVLLDDIVGRAFVVFWPRSNWQWL